MLDRLLAAASAAVLAAGGAAIAYTALALSRVMAFRARRPWVEDHVPAVTILKPLRGLEHELFENLCSFCDQEYPEFQVVFGARDPDDPAVALAQRVMQAFPERDLAIVVGYDASLANPKVANLANMLGSAKHALLVVADSDMRVDRSYLRTLVAPFADRRVGAVTCLYGALPAPGLASALGGMFIQDHFAPQVLVAAALEGLRFCLGATMAVRRSVLDEIGGFAELGSYLADDYMLGALVSARGYRVALSRYVVHDVVHERDLSALWLHELRWARTIRAVRPAGHAFMFLTYALPLALLFLLLSRASALSLVLLALALALRLALHYAARAAFGSRTAAAPWLIPLRDVLCLGVWAASLLGGAMQWRGERMEIGPGGRIAAPPAGTGLSGRRSR